MRPLSLVARVVYATFDTHFDLPYASPQSRDLVEIDTGAE